MNTLGINIIGRWGNQLFQFAYARALAEKHGWKLNAVGWSGKSVFVDDPILTDAPPDLTISGYFQSQEDLIYTRMDVLSWFIIKPSLQSFLSRLPEEYKLAHRRNGDYIQSGFPVISKASYLAVAPDAVFVTEEEPCIVNGMPEGFSFLPDFWRMMHCRRLIRSNSSFSWWAATLGDAVVLSPVINGLCGGKEHDGVKFVEGNWPRLANLDFTTNLHLRPSKWDSYV